MPNHQDAFAELSQLAWKLHKAFKRRDIDGAADALDAIGQKVDAMRDAYLGASTDTAL